MRRWSLVAVYVRMFAFLFALPAFVAAQQSPYSPALLAQTGGTSSSPVSFGGEETDWSVKPTSSLTTTYHAKTPLEIPGARRVSTVELKAMLDGTSPPLLVDVLGGDVKKRLVLPGAVSLGFEAGNGKVYFAEKKRFEDVLAKLTGNDKEKPMVFYCLSSECWLSYNAALRAVDGGYSKVLWYRGGTVAWKAAGYSLVPATPFDW
jgi:PQQ-dependent catabolism-associated CXXCW motif protein